MRPVPDSNFSCWKVVANRALAPHLDYVEYDASLFGCQVCHILVPGGRGGGGVSHVPRGGSSYVRWGVPRVREGGSHVRWGVFTCWGGGGEGGGLHVRRVGELVT